MANRGVLENLLKLRPHYMNNIMREVCVISDDCVEEGGIVKRTAALLKVDCRSSRVASRRSVPSIQSWRTHHPPDKGHTVRE